MHLVCKPSVLFGADTAGIVLFCVFTASHSKADRTKRKISEQQKKLNWFTAAASTTYSSKWIP